VRFPLTGLTEPVNDPEPAFNGWQPNTRDASLVVGQHAMRAICQKLGFDFIDRVHHVVQFHVLLQAEAGKDVLVSLLLWTLRQFRSFDALRNRDELHVYHVQEAG
jgi:hypothetical protein